MATLEITNNDTTGLVLWDPVFEGNTIVDAGGDTYLAGTVLGRITASGKLTAYTSGAADGSEIPLAVLHEDLVLAAATDYPIRAIISGRVRRADLIAFGVGAITVGEADELRGFGIISLSTVELSQLDNA
jgi:hypothetical protein